MNQVLREIVADEIERRADTDDRLRLATVTAVDVSADLRHARVYLASLSPGAEEALGEARLQIQHAIGRQVRMKRTPQLEFAQDPGVAQGGRVDEILRNLQPGVEPDPSERPGAAPEADRGAGA